MLAQRTKFWAVQSLNIFVLWWSNNIVIRLREWVLCRMNTSNRHIVQGRETLINTILSSVTAEIFFALHSIWNNVNASNLLSEWKKIVESGILGNMSLVICVECHLGFKVCVCVWVSVALCKWRVWIKNLPWQKETWICPKTEFWNLIGSHLKKVYEVHR